MSKEQVDWARQTLQDNRQARWTIVIIHRPIWSYATIDKNGKLEIEMRARRVCHFDAVGDDYAVAVTRIEVNHARRFRGVRMLPS